MPNSGIEWGSRPIERVSVILFVLVYGVYVGIQAINSCAMSWGMYLI